MLNNFIIETVKGYFALKHQPGQIVSPKKIIDYIVEKYHQENFPGDYFVCIFLAVIDIKTEEITYSSVGFQLPPLFLLKNGKVMELGTGGLPVSSASSGR
ncbi:serine phosphatase RsbU (regulator of sigma subunit) [Desulfitispora alkaliphila]|uniref:SpoIIE family protein phosphatase n=1 Tax=Desulfitispora alkaliphila TaxID=622674 RepID=UPI003D26311E